MPDSTDVAVDTMITVTFDPALPDGGNWVLTVADVGGTEVPGSATLADDGTSATFVPEADLAFETVYTVSATACDDTKSAEFLTGAAPIDAASLAGMTYAIQEDDLMIEEPAGAALLLAFIPGGLFGTLAVQFTDYNEADQTFGGLGAVIGEDDAIFCEQQVSTTIDFSGNPVLSFGPEDLAIEVQPGLNVDLEDLTVTGRVADDGMSLVNPRISLAIATENLPLGEFSIPACPDITELITPTCVPCDSSDSGECVLFEGTVAEAGSLDRDIEQECATN